MRYLLFRFASWLKAATCSHMWISIDYGRDLRVSTSDEIEVRFRCHRCGLFLVKLGRPGATVEVANGPMPLRATLRALRGI